MFSNAISFVIIDWLFDNQRIQTSSRGHAHAFDLLSAYSGIFCYKSSFPRDFDGSLPVSLSFQKIIGEGVPVLNSGTDREHP